jgi:diguanylate cyclase (GGDEF)-like protein/PAS domain S-box-containing protein
MEPESMESNAVQSGLDLVADPAFAVDQDFRVVAANRACVALIGESISRWMGEVPLELVHPDDLPIVLSSFTEVAGKEFGTPIEIRIQVADGGFRLMEAIGATHPTDDGHIVVVSMRDLTERRRWELAAGHAERFRAVVEHASVVLALTDANGRIDSASGTFNRHLGHDQSRVVGSNLADWVVVEERAPFRVSLARAAASPRTSVFEATIEHADGRLIPYQFSVANLLGDPVVQGLIVSAADISARRALEARLTQLATTDPLTGLANRAALVTDLASRLASRSPSTSLVVFFIDLDRFKPVNDLHGHDAGDTVLAILAQRLGGVARGDDLVARLGGDEFVMVCDDVREHDALTICRRIEEAVAAPIDVGGATVQVFASVGHADVSTASTAEGLLAEADAAMYRVKQRRRGRPSSPALPVAHRRGLVADLTGALAGDPAAAGLRVYFQPVIALPGGSFSGAEALVRWQHPTLGLLPPAEFLPIAEDAGLDLALGRWIIDTAIAHAAAWPDESSVVAVNLGAGELTDPGAVDMVLDALDRDGLTPSRLCVEVTETTLLERAAAGNRVAAITALERLKHAGVQVAIDDFGTGYSSLVHVRELPASTLKIDRSFVAGLPADDADRGIVAAVIALAHGVGMTVVAEGVETEAQHRALCSLGADFGQGYLYSRPMPAADLARWRDEQQQQQRAAS